MFAPSYIVMAVSIIVQVLAQMGVHVGTEELTTTITTLVTIGSALYVMYRQIATGKSTLGGFRPK